MGVRNRSSVACAAVAGIWLTGACAGQPATTFEQGDAGGDKGGSGSSSGGSTVGSTGGSTGGSSGGGSSGGSGGGSTGGSSGASGSASGGSGGGSGSTSSSGSSGGSSSGSTSSGGDAGCAAQASAGAIVLTTNYVPASVVGDGGYAYAYDDKMGSTACLDPAAYCGAGSTGVATPTGTVWGAGIGSSLNQAMATGSASPPIATYAVTGSGIAYALDNLPAQGMRLIIDQAGADYCAPITAASGTVKWSSFNTKCWDGSGTTLAAAPQTATHVQFQVTAGAAVASFAFCVKAISFAP